MSQIMMDILENQVIREAQPFSTRLQLQRKFNDDKETLSLKTHKNYNYKLVCTSFRFTEQKLLYAHFSPKLFQMEFSYISGLATIKYGNGHIL